MDGERIASDLTYVTRDAWGADRALPRLGAPVPRTRRTHIVLHHTAGVDADATANVWETGGEVAAAMRRLQVARPDLGRDVPYSFVAFLMPGGRIAVCEGRGPDRTGAHTAGHNTEGIGLALAGDFESYRTDLRPWTDPLGRFLGWLRREQGMARLGSVHPRDRATFVHRDFVATACPGQAVVDAAGALTFIEEEEMAKLWMVTADGVFYFATDGLTRRYLRRPSEVDELRRAGILRDGVVALSRQALNNIPRVDSPRG